MKLKDEDDYQRWDGQREGNAAEQPKIARTVYACGLEQLPRQLVPVVRAAGNMNLAGLAAGIADVSGRTREGSIRAEKLSGGTFSIANIGSVGALFDTPIINQPQVGKLGVGTIVKRAVVIADGDNVLAIRHMMYLCLTYDHRTVDGADAGRFLAHVRARLETGAFEAELGL